MELCDIERPTVPASEPDVSPTVNCQNFFPDKPLQLVASSVHQHYQVPHLSKMANYSEKQFQHCLKKVKSGFLNNPYGISIWSGYVCERNSHAVLLFIGNKKPIKTDSVSLWGQFPPSGALRKICKAFNFALFGGEIFWKEFRSCKDVEVLEKVCKLMQIQQKEAIPTLQSDNQLKRKKFNLHHGKLIKSK